MHEEAGDQCQNTVLCDAEIQVTPDRKNARVQTSTRMKSIGKHMNKLIQLQVFMVMDKSID